MHEHRIRITLISVVFFFSSVFSSGTVSGQPPSLLETWAWLGYGYGIDIEDIKERSDGTVVIEKGVYGNPPLHVGARSIIQKAKEGNCVII